MIPVRSAICIGTPQPCQTPAVTRRKYRKQTENIKPRSERDNRQQCDQGHRRNRPSPWSLERNGAFLGRTAGNASNVVDSSRDESVGEGRRCSMYPISETPLNSREGRIRTSGLAVVADMDEEDASDTTGRLTWVSADMESRRG